MKRIISYIILCLMIMAVSTPVLGTDIQDSDYALFTFENGLPEGIRSENGSVSIGEGVFGGGLCVDATGANAVVLPFSFESGVRYRISAWMQGKNTGIRVGETELEVEQTLNGENGWMYAEGTVVSGQNTELAFLCDGDFSLDDCMIVSEKRDVRVKGNLVSNGNFDTDLSDWTVSGVKWEQTEGANNTPGALSYEVLSDFGCAKSKVDVYFGRTYKVSWYAKAVSKDAVGLDMKYIFDRVAYREDTATPKYFEKTVGSLSEEWQYFELTHKERNLTTDQCSANLYFRAGTGKEKVTFAIDEVVIEEIPETYVVDTVISLTNNRTEKERLNGAFTLQGNGVGTYYRLMQEFGEGFAVMDSGYTEDAVRNFTLQESEFTKYRLAGNAKDANGIVGKTFYSDLRFKADEYKPELHTNIEEEIWTPDTEMLSAEVSCAGSDGGKRLTAYLATYNENGGLANVSTSDMLYSAGEKTTLGIPTEDAVCAKLMLFDAESFKPVKAADVLQKTTKGTFLYVNSQTGRDFADGTKEAPLKSINGAKVKVRALLKSATEDIYVVFEEGEYPHLKTVTLTENDSSEHIRVSYVAEKRGKVSFNGGIDVTGFHLWDEEQNIYRAYVGQGVRSRQFFVNGIRATRARSEGGLENAVNLGAEGVGYTTTDMSLLSYRHIEDLEFNFFEEWTHSYVGVDSVRDNGDGTVTVVMREKDWYDQWYRKGNCLPSVPEYIENALELLDEEGEWYLDTHEGYLYYKPRIFENIDTVRAVLPTCEKMLKLAGRTAFSPIHNITFRGIVFENNTWNVPSDPGGFCCGQNNGYLDGEEQFIPGAVHVENANGVAFENCQFARLGMTGMKMNGGLKNCRVVGNEFYDISAGALVVGDVSANRAHNPADEAYYVENIDVTDNYMHVIAVDYKGGACLSTGFPRDSRVLHNEIYDTSYSGMHLGWGWNSYSVSVTQDFTVKGNYIHKVLNTDIYDGGSVYFLGRTNGSSEHPNRYEENYHYDIGNAYGMIYPDNGSTNWDILSNVCDLTKNPVWHRNYNEGDEGYDMPARWLHIHMSTITDIYMKNNYTTTESELNNGIVNVVQQDLHVHTDADWPEEAQEIVARSGIREPYSDNFRYGLQEVDVNTEVTIQEGESKGVDLLIQTRKEFLYDKANYEVYTSSENPEIATMQDGVVTAHSKGKTEILLYVKEGNILKTRKIYVTVV